ncbi:hypothetical protein COV23_02455 [Candidatus Wolfebacteria bacterium CG10_big_fil_rev_8_21_14_0_10_31_9]|uniref:Penicillin-binding protein 2 n=1 Tax=Candidatus Wolfebacteria bacterium CG10_big_fil_rev_8_21_14_0_10_31_9 TaxID=1975070 RepID=A0A2H0RBT2_9BACT|nr:MAG: hypothetical protein COV23_02455 [Candidatus Wolfebacteria bacterium CG10_big_fil_rev_8_21_14_0_10_31_9]
MNNKKELFLEEAILDDMSQSLDALEVPLSRSIFHAISLFVILIGVIVFGRVAFLGFNDGNFYKNRALINISDVNIISAERGIFYDRYGKQLVKNIPTFHATLKLSDFFKKSENDKNIEVDSLENILNITQGQIKQSINEINLEKESSLVIARDLTIEQIAKIKNINFNDVDIENDFSRKYEEPGGFSHILGYVGVASREDLDNNSKLSFNDLVGKSGLEYFYNNKLTGKNGGIINYRNSKNESIGQNSIIDSIAGNDLYLTIDADLQSYFYKRLKSQIENMNSAGGVGIIINPQNGEVLSLISLPSFDNNKITSIDVTDSIRRPLFNRAVSGLYSPGSTIKPLVATAMLMEKTVSPLKEILSIGYILIPNPYHPESPSKFVDWKAQGWVNMYSALAKSSNVYFYEVGGGYQDVQGLGINRLREYWEKFGLKEKTNIDLPSEKSGFLPDSTEKEKRTGIPWRIGDTYNVSIGQGDIMITPIELINYICSIATGGKFYQPHIVQKVMSDKNNVVTEFKPVVIRDNTYMADALIEVEKGMIDVTQKPYGTAVTLKDLPFITAAKTGSAQVEFNTKTNAFFVGYGPVKGDPEKQIAILVLIENAKEGNLNAVPVAKDVLRWYYDNRIANKH